MTYHTPVLLNESIGALQVKESGVYADLTFGGGGYARAILDKLKKGRLYAFDQDTDAFENLPDRKNIIPIHANFRHLSNFMRYYGEEKLDGIIADLGVSMHQFAEEKRGFTYRSNTALDMRMNKTAKQTAADVINTYSYEKLAELFRIYADLPNAGPVAKAIVKSRETEKINTTGQLADSLTKFYRPDTRNKFLSKVFQALRIEVNHEMEALSEMLPQAVSLLKKNGRLVILSYHSVEDRILKNFIKSGNTEGKIHKDIMGNSPDMPLRIITPRPIVAPEKEVSENPAARSAKLRIAEKI
jgi:16S rRNA (cytosine1402-N4)-methyltransferase